MKRNKQHSEEILLSQGNNYNAKGDFKNAIKTYSKIIKLNPISALAYNNLGTVYAEMKELDKAQNFYTTAQTLQPENTLFSINLAALLLDKGDIESACSLIRKNYSSKAR